MDYIKISLRSGKTYTVPIRNGEQFENYVEQKNDKRARFWVSPSLAINLDLIDTIELVEEENKPFSESELDF